MEDHRVVEDGRDLWRSTSPTALLKTGVARTNFSRLCPDRLWISLRVEILLNPLIGAHLYNWPPALQHTSRRYLVLHVPQLIQEPVRLTLWIAFHLCTFMHSKPHHRDCYYWIPGFQLSRQLLLFDIYNSFVIFTLKKSCFYEYSIRLF